jgi:hypothetical protein
MEKKIIVKEIDKFLSVVNKDRVVTEYVIYLMIEDVRAEGFIELGEEAMKLRVSEISLTHGVEDNNFELPVEMVSFEEMYNIKPKQNQNG